jgi:hypothetical protein
LKAILNVDWALVLKSEGMVIVSLGRDADIGKMCFSCDLTANTIIANHSLAWHASSSVVHGPYTMKRTPLVIASHPLTGRINS